MYRYIFRSPSFGSLPRRGEKSHIGGHRWSLQNLVAREKDNFTASHYKSHQRSWHLPHEDRSKQRQEKVSNNAPLRIKFCLAYKKNAIIKKADDYNLGQPTTSNGNNSDKFLN